MGKARRLCWSLFGGKERGGAGAGVGAQQARVILSDEGVVSRDPASARLVMSTLREINRHDRTAVIVSLHQIDHAFEHCDRIIALKEGHVIHNGPTSEIARSEEHTSELQSLMRITYAVVCLKKKKKYHTSHKEKHQLHKKN